MDVVVADVVVVENVVVDSTKERVFQLSARRDQLQKSFFFAGPGPATGLSSPQKRDARFAGLAQPSVKNGFILKKQNVD